MLYIKARSPVHTSQFFENERKNDQLKIINSYIINPPPSFIYIDTRDTVSYIHIHTSKNSCTCTHVRDLHYIDFIANLNYNLKGRVAYKVSMKSLKRMLLFPKNFNKVPFTIYTNIQVDCKQTTDKSELILGLDTGISAD